MIKTISARDHVLFKKLNVLTKGSSQQKHTQVAIEGIHLAQAWMQLHGIPDYCVTTEEALSHTEVAQLVARIPSQHSVLLSQTLFRSLSSLTQGTTILFLVTPPSAACPERIKEDCVILDRVQDPGNVGSILRSSAAMGVKSIFCITGTASVWSPKVLRAGMGAQFQLNTVERIEAATVLDKLAIPLLAMDARAQTNLYQQNLHQPIAWVLGNEGSGVSQQFKERAQLTAIPQPGGTESLNVAAAAAVCLFETLRQRSFPT